MCVCVCVCVCGGVEGGRGAGGLFTTSSQQQVLYLHTFISKTFSRRFFDCQYSFNNSM